MNVIPSERDAYYKKSGKGVEDILLCENDCLFEGGQSNFFAVKNGTMVCSKEQCAQWFLQFVRS